MTAFIINICGCERDFLKNSSLENFSIFSSFLCSLVRMIKFAYTSVFGKDHQNFIWQLLD